MDELEIEARTYKNVTVLPFLLSETPSKNAAFLADVPRDYKIFPSAWEEMQPYLDI